MPPIMRRESGINRFRNHVRAPGREADRRRIGKRKEMHMRDAEDMATMTDIEIAAESEIRTEIARETETEIEIGCAIVIGIGTEIEKEIETEIESVVENARDRAQRKESMDAIQQWRWIEMVMWMHARDLAV